MSLTIAKPGSTIPLFVAAGSIITMAVSIPNTSTPQQLTEIRVYPGRTAEFALYDDDGETYAYEKGKGRLPICAGTMSADNSQRLVMH